MGSCATKPPRVFPKSQYPRVVKVSLFCIDREYLRPEVRNGIFMAKDQKTPILNLEANKFYQLRKSQNKLVLEKGC